MDHYTNKITGTKATVRQTGSSFISVITYTDGESKQRRHKHYDAVLRFLNKWSLEMMNSIAHCSCGCADQWLFISVISGSQVMECSNCQHIEYAKEHLAYLDENGTPLERF